MSLKFAANLSMMFQEVDFLDRFEQASKQGFSGVEYLFPYAYTPQELSILLAKYSLKQILFNLPPGDWDAGDRGIACLPDRMEQFEADIEQAVLYAKALGVKQVHCLSGLLPLGVSFDIANKVYKQNIKKAAEAFEKIGVNILLEPINHRDMPNYFMNTTSQAISIIKELNRPNIGLQFDIYHCQISEGDILRRIKNLFPFIHHYQIASVPLRNEPNTGELNDDFILDQIDKLGYTGWVGCEYIPKTNTIEGLRWLRARKY